MALPVVEVLIEEVTDDAVHVIDGMTKRYKLPLVMRANGMKPRPNEIWFMSRETGYWNLSGVKDRIPAPVTGSRGQNAALASLLSVLETGGLIDDQTTLGSAPGGGAAYDAASSSAAIDGTGHAAVTIAPITDGGSGIGIISISTDADSGSTGWWNIDSSGFGFPLRVGVGLANIMYAFAPPVYASLSAFDIEVPGATSGTAQVTVIYPL